MTSPCDVLTYSVTARLGDKSADTQTVCVLVCFCIGKPFVTATGLGRPHKFEGFPADMTERERERKRERERERERERQRQTDRQTDTQTHRQTKS